MWCDGNYIETQTNGFKWRLVINGNIHDDGILIVVGKLTLRGKLNNGKSVIATIIGFPFGFTESWTVNGVKIY
jgi:hypothetical protein